MTYDTPSVFRHREVIPKAHRILDIRYRPPIYVMCVCGWKRDATSAVDVEQQWKAHKAQTDQ